MIHLILEMSDETYEQLRCGIKYGFFTFSLEDLERLDIKVASVQHTCGEQAND